MMLVTNTHGTPFRARWKWVKDGWMLALWDMSSDTADAPDYFIPAEGAYHFAPADD